MFLQLFTRLPPVLERDTTVDGNRVDRRNELLSRALKWTMSVGEKKRYREKGHPDFHAYVLRLFLRVSEIDFSLPKCWVEANVTLVGLVCSRHRKWVRTNHCFLFQESGGFY